MSEIKSTMDLVLEKTKHLTLSEDEKRAQKKKAAGQALAGLLQKYDDDILDIDRLKDQLNTLKKTYESIDTHILVGEILNRIQLDRDNTAFLNLLDEVCQLESSSLRSILAEFQQTVNKQIDQRADQTLSKLSRDYYISGSAILPNLALDDEWGVVLQSIHAEYHQLLDREKANLLNIG